MLIFALKITFETICRRVWEYFPKVISELLPLPQAEFHSRPVPMRFPQSGISASWILETHTKPMVLGVSGLADRGSTTRCKSQICSVSGLV
jgi:hypothetical protein